MTMKARSDWLLKLLLSFAIRLAKLFTIIYKTPTAYPTGSTARFRQHSPVSPATETKDPPPKHNVSIAVAPSGIVLSWYMALLLNHASRITFLTNHASRQKKVRSVQYRNIKSYFTSIEHSKNEES